MSREPGPPDHQRKERAMTREELIEKAARAIHQHGVDVGSEGGTWDGLMEFVRDQYRGDARAALDAVLPLILTTTRTEN